MWQEAIAIAARTAIRAVVAARTVARAIVAHAAIVAVAARIVTAATQQFSSDLHCHAPNQRRTELIFLQSSLLPKLFDNTSENPRRSHTDPALKIYNFRQSCTVRPQNNAK